MEAYLINILLYFMTGILAGAMAGLFGLGGGIVIVPALSYIFLNAPHIPNDHIMHMAAGTSLAAMVITVQASARAHYSHGRILWPVYKRMMPGLIIGTLFGVFLADNLNTQILRLIFSFLLIFIALRMIIKEQLSKASRLPGRTAMVSASSAIGTTAGLLGIGGGVLMIPYLTHYNIPMRNTAGVSSVSSFTVALIGSIACVITGLDELDLPKWSTGYIYWPAVLSIVVTSSVAAPIAAKHAYRLPVNTLKKLFALILMIIGTHMLFYSLKGIL